jgi:hypothetical protein
VSQVEANRGVKWLVDGAGVREHRRRRRSGVGDDGDGGGGGNSQMPPVRGVPVAEGYDHQVFCHTVVVASAGSS